MQAAKGCIRMFVPLHCCAGSVQVTSGVITSGVITLILLQILSAISAGTWLWQGVFWSLRTAHST